MDVAGALLPFTQVVRPELTIHVQEVLTQADKETEGQKKLPIPSLQINEPTDDINPVRSDTVLKSPVRKYVNAPKNFRKGNPA